MTSDRLRKRIDGVTARRARTVLDHILKHGQITTEELKNLYGYDHPPRAARDVREQGIPLVTVNVTGSNGRTIGAYRLGSDDELDERKRGGRRAFPKALKDNLVALTGESCALCGGRFPARALQVDHRVPYEVASDEDFDDANLAAFMLVCGSCNRSKSWSCEHCANWTTFKVEATCQSCMWGSPEVYSHIAMEERRSTQLNWSGSEVAEYERLATEAARAGVDLESYLKRKLSSKPAL